MSTAPFTSRTFSQASVAVMALTLFAGTSHGSAQTVATKELPLVWVLSTGGTIAGKGTSATDLSNYKSGSILGEELVRSVREIRQVANVRVEQIANVSRVGNGRVIGRQEYDALGMIPADTLNPQKARILLMLALTKTTDRKQIARMFTEY